jgi:two-component system chemotaxis response regulator CheY
MSYLNDRISARFECESMEILINDSMFTFCGDISQKGVFIKTEEYFEPSSIVSLYIAPYDFRIDAEVMYVIPETGAGLKFLINSEEDKRNVDSIITNIMASPEKVNYKLQILLVGSHNKLRKALKKRLHKDGFSVTEADDGMEAIQKLNAFPINAIIMDLNTKKIPSAELIKMIRESPTYASVPILAYTLTNNKDFMETAYGLGVSQCMAKEDATPDMIMAALLTTLWSQESKAY